MQLTLWDNPYALPARMDILPVDYCWLEVADGQDDGLNPDVAEKIRQVANYEEYLATSIMMTRSSLEGLELMLDGSNANLFRKYLSVGGQPVETAIALVLHDINMPDSTFHTLMTDDQARGKFLAAFRQGDRKDGNLQTLVSKNNGVWFYEPGKLGFVHVDKYRDRIDRGQPLDRQNMERITRIQASENFLCPDRQELVFFTEPQKRKDKRLMINKDTHQPALFSVQPDAMTGGTEMLYLSSFKVLPAEQVEKDWYDITGRITDVKITRGADDNTYLSCSMDGKRIDNWVLSKQMVTRADNLLWGDVSAQSKREYSSLFAAEALAEHIYQRIIVPQTDKPVFDKVNLLPQSEQLSRVLLRARYQGEWLGGAWLATADADKVYTCMRRYGTDSHEFRKLGEEMAGRYYRQQIEDRTERQKSSLSR